MTSRCIVKQLDFSPYKIHLTYKILKSKKQKNPVEVQRKWITKFMPETPDKIDWKAVYKTPFLCTKISKLIVF